MTKIFRVCMLGVLLPCSLFSGLFMIPEESVLVQGKGIKPLVKFEEGNFSVLFDGKTQSVKPHDISGFPSTITADQLMKFLNYGYISLKKIGEDYEIGGIIRALGGGNTPDLTPAQQAYLNSASASAPHDCGPFALAAAFAAAKGGGVAGGIVVPVVGAIPGSVFTGIVGGFVGFLACEKFLKKK